MCLFLVQNLSRVVWSAAMVKEKYDLEVSQKFFYRTVNLWNSLDNSFKLCNSIDVFKTRLRTKLLKEL